MRSAMVELGPIIDVSHQPSASRVRRLLRGPAPASPSRARLARGGVPLAYQRPVQPACSLELFLAVAQLAAQLDLNSEHLLDLCAQGRHCRGGVAVLRVLDGDLVAKCPSEPALQRTDLLLGFAGLLPWRFPSRPSAMRRSAPFGH